MIHESIQQKCVQQIQNGRTSQLLARLNSSFQMGFSNFNECRIVIKIINFIPAQDYDDMSFRFIYSLVQKIYNFYNYNKCTVKIIQIYRSICLKSLQSQRGFHEIHVRFLKLVIENRYYKLALDILKIPLVKISDLKPSQLLEYLYYAGIIYTVLMMYPQAASMFTNIIQIEKDDTNLKIDTFKKLKLINSLLGRHTLHLVKLDLTPYNNVCSQNFDQIQIQNLPYKNIFIEDGNINLVKKLKYTSQLNMLEQYSNNHVRIPATNDKLQTFSTPQKILNLNKIRNLYRFNLRQNCIVFLNKYENFNIEDQISKIVDLFINLKQEDNRKKKKLQDKDQKMKRFM